MNSSLSPCRSELNRILAAAGAFSYGIAKADEVSEQSKNLYRRWLESGYQASMTWMDRYIDLRDDPRLLLEGTRSVIVSTFPYSAPVDVAPDSLRFASYALGEDYHEVIRKRLRSAARLIEEKFGGSTRICVDTAPLRERYWAMQAGVGFIARNCQLVVPGAGSRFFLGTILSTVDFPADRPIENNCLECGKCVESCPGKALSKEGIPSLDSNKCRSYLTVEHRHELPPGIRLGKEIYGCDICQNVCPLNTVSIKPLAEFLPRKELLSLSRERLIDMSEEEYRALFRKSAIRRASLAMLRRNAGSDTQDRGK